MALADPRMKLYRVHETGCCFSAWVGGRRCPAAGCTGVRLDNVEYIVWTRT